MSTALERAHALCREITLRRGPNFSLGFSLLPPPKRRAVYAAYAFCRRADDLADEGPATPEAALAALDQWQEELLETYVGQPSHPVGLALHDALQHYPIPRASFEGLIEGCRHDLHGREYPDFDALVGYCDLVATTIGRISLSIFGVAHPDAHRLGRRLSLALQLTNILRDVREDAQRGRVYLPLEELAAEGVSADRLVAGEAGEGFLRVMRRNIGRAAECFAGAARLVDCVEADARAATRCMGGVYVEVLRRIAADPARVLRERVELDPDEKRELLQQHGEGQERGWRLAES